MSARVKTGEASVYAEQPRQQGNASVFPPREVDIAGEDKVGGLLALRSGEDADEDDDEGRHGVIETRAADGWQEAFDQVKREDDDVGTLVSDKPHPRRIDELRVA